MGQIVGWIYKLKQIWYKQYVVSYTTNRVDNFKKTAMKRVV